MKRGLALILLLAAAIVAALAVFVSGAAPAGPAGVLSPSRLDVARADILRHRATEAEKTLRDILRDRPDDRVTRLLLGWVLTDRGRLAEAKESYEGLLKVDAKDVDALRGLARVLLGMRQAPAAVARLRAAVDLRKEDPSLWKEFGLAQRDAGDSMAAFASIQKSLALDPDQADLAALLTDLLQAPAIPGMPGQPHVDPTNPLSPTGGLKGPNRPRPPGTNPLAPR